ncbi:MAG: Holliday junction resolvase RuvX [Oscillospiraceae bacterium]|nr:Holliday junction resolvase RuvX [Oscillospiraceae bacterium]
MKVMALDYGDARTGVAVSDSLGLLAGETAVLPSWNHQKLLEDVAALAKDKGIDTVVLGLPRNMDGSEGPRAEKSRAFAAELEEKGLKVVFVDERRTTLEAHGILSEAGKRGKKRRDRIDAVAATLILETYLNGLRN